MLSQQFGAWVAAAITALSIQLQALSAPAIDMVNFVSDPFNVVYTNSEEGLESYLNQSTISITPNGTVIDGETYDDVWLSHDAAEIFRTNAFDFTTAYSIASNTNGTFASGAGTILDIPTYNVDGVIKTQRIDFPADFTGVLPINSQLELYRNGSYAGFNINGSSFQITNNAYNVLPGSFDMRPNRLYFYKSDSSLYNSLSSGAFAFIEEPFSFDYVSGNIPVDVPLASDEGMLLHIPHHSGTSHFSQFIEDYPEFIEPDGIEIDPTIDPDIYTKLDDLINIIAPLIPVINAEFSTAPDPAPVPVPDDTIADTLFSELRTILNNIIQTIASIPTAISALGDRILEDIELGPIRVFQKVLDLFRTIFAPVINLITAGIGIWSYVVSWLSAISLPFNFVLSVIPAGIMIPIYAGVAGWLVIAIFRRFGR